MFTMVFAFDFTGLASVYGIQKNIYMHPWVKPNSL